MFCGLGPALGQETAKSEPIRLVDAVREGAAHGPGVRLAQAPLPLTVEANRTASRLLRPPMLTLTGGYRDTGAATGPELGASVAQDVPLANVGARRRELAQAWGNQTRREVRRATLDAATRAALAWSDCLEADTLWRLRREAATNAEQIFRLSRVRVQAGTALPSEEALARSDVAIATAAALESEGGIIDSYAELRLALGRPVSAPIVAVGSLEPEGSREEPREAFPAAAVGAHPAVEQAQARAVLARTQTELVGATLGPSVVLGAGYLREGGGTHVVTAFVGLPLPFTRPAAFDRARERGDQLRAEVEVEQVKGEIEKRLSLAAHERVHWRRAAAALRTGALAAKEALRVAIANFEAGTLDVSTVLLARQRALSAEEQAVHASAEVQRADIRFDALTGRLLEGARR
jgi:outer membrane protein TolC